MRRFPINYTHRGEFDPDGSIRPGFSFGREWIALAGDCQLRGSTLDRVPDVLACSVLVVAMLPKVAKYEVLAAKRARVIAWSGRRAHYRFSLRSASTQIRRYEQELWVSGLSTPAVSGLQQIVRVWHNRITA